MKQYPTQERLRELFDYHPDGYLVWKYRDCATPRVNTVFCGKIAGCFGVRHDGRYYNNIGIDGKNYRACALVWIWHNGEIPIGFAVRKNTEVKNNKIENLWLAKPAENNKGSRHANRAENGYIGVSKRGKSFRAQLNKIKLGTFSSEIAAAAAVDAKRRELNPKETLFNLDFEFDFEPYRTKKTGRPRTRGDAF